MIVVKSLCTKFAEYATTQKFHHCLAAENLFKIDTDYGTKINGIPLALFAKKSQPSIGHHHDILDGMGKDSLCCMHCGIMCILSLSNLIFAGAVYRPDHLSMPKHWRVTVKYILIIVDNTVACKAEFWHRCLFVCVLYLCLILLCLVYGLFCIVFYELNIIWELQLLFLRTCLQDFIIAVSTQNNIARNCCHYRSILDHPMQGVLSDPLPFCHVPCLV